MGLRDTHLQLEADLQKCGPSRVATWHLVDLHLTLEPKAAGSSCARGYWNTGGNSPTG